jgi:3-deoxy-D-manno-octulosonic-acid transferase
MVRRFYRKALDTFSYFFVQNEGSKLLQQLGKTMWSFPVTPALTALPLLEKDNDLDYISQFKTTP